MAEGLAFAASVIAVIQMTDRIATVVNFYIETLRDELPADMRAILTEMKALKTVFESLQSSLDGDMSKNLAEPIDECKKSLAALEGLLPVEPTATQTSSHIRPEKKSKMKAARLALAWSYNKSGVKRLLDNTSRQKATIHLMFTVESLTDHQRWHVYDWLKHTDPSPLHNQTCNQQTPGTAEWVCKMSEWTDWINMNFRCLWIHGIPGAGKTVLMSYLIGQLQHRCHSPSSTSVAFVYYYCYYGHNQDEAAPFLRWLLNQLCRRSDVIPRSLYKLYKIGTEPTIVELLLVLKDVLGHFDRVYVVVDALDESNPRGKLLDVVQKLATNTVYDKIQTLVSSREYPEIQSVLSTFAVPVSMDNKLVREDIRICVRSLLRSKNTFRHWSSDLHDEVEETLSTRAQGMFRWAVCQVDVLRRLKGDRDVIKKALRTLPRTLNEVYDRIFLMIDEHERLYALHALLWVVNTQSDGVQSNIPTGVLPTATTKSASRFDTNYIDRFYDFEIIGDILGCLVRETGYSTVALAHYTVQEYLYSPKTSTVLMSITSMPPLSTRDIILQIMFEGALALRDFTVCDDFNLRFEEFCVANIIFQIEEGQMNMLNEAHISLALELLDPSGPHYTTFLAICMFMCSHQGPWVSRSQIWSVRSGAPTSAIKAFHLLNIFQLFQYSNQEFGIALAQKLAVRPPYHKAFQMPLSFQMDGKSVLGFRDTLSDWCPVLALIFYQSAEEGQFSLGTHGSSLAFLSAVHKGRQCCCRVANGQCELRRLLQSGVSPDDSRHSVTPLQIATICRDFESVQLLLEAGADPNKVGTDQTGDTSRTSDLAEPDAKLNRTSYGQSRCGFELFLYILDISPLSICRHYRMMRLRGGYRLGFEHVDETTQNEEDRVRVENLLLKYGAEEFGMESPLPTGSAKIEIDYGFPWENPRCKCARIVSATRSSTPSSTRSSTPSSTRSSTPTPMEDANIS